MKKISIPVNSCYIDEYRKEYFNEGDIQDWEIYEQR